MTDGAVKPAGAKQLRKRTDVAHRLARIATQVVFLVFAPSLFSGAFGGIRYLCTQVGLGAIVEPTAFVLQLVALLGFTFVFGRFFCGYACAFGALGDWLYAAFELLRAKAGLPRPAFPKRLVDALALLKYVVLACVCVACFMGAWPSIASHSPWTAYASVLAGSIDALDIVGAVLLGAIVVLMMLRERAFCQFLCPLGAVFSLLPVLPFSEFVRTRDHCARRCGRCREACPMDIWPDADAMGHGECVLCGRCADVCPMQNVNMIAVQKKREDSAPAEQTARPTRKSKEKWYLLRGSEIGYVLVRAAILLAVCWAIGATRYLPTFPL